MRYDAEHKDKTRQRVLKEAARAIRAEGPHRVAVAGVMAKAGLTHGGFYAHFASKDELVAEAIGTMFEDAAKRFGREADGRDSAAALDAYIDFYLSTAHRDAPSTGCPLPSLSADLPRLAEPARQRFEQGVAALTGRIAGLLTARGQADAEALAGSVIAELVGALALSRAVADPVRSQSILDNSRAALKTRLGLESPA